MKSSFGLIKLEGEASSESCEEAPRTLVLNSRNFYLLTVRWSSCFCGWKTFNLHRVQSREPSELRDFFLSAPTPVISSSLHARASISVSGSSVLPLWKLMSEEVDGSLQAQHTLLPCYFSFCLCSPFVPLLSLSFWTCMRLSGTDH